MTSYQESDSANGTDAHGSTAGCLIPSIVATVVTAVLITLVSWMLLGEDDVDQPAASVKATTAETTPRAVSADGTSLPVVAERPTEAEPPSEPTGEARVSWEAISTIIASQGFQMFGRPEVIDLGSQRQTTRKFRNDDRQLEVTTYQFNTIADAQEVRLELGPAAQRVRLANQVVVVKPLTDTAGESVDALAKKLRRFRAILDSTDPAE